MTHAVDPYVMVLLDDQEHRFFYNALVAKRATKELRRDNLESSGLDVLIAMFYWADETIDHAVMTLDQYAEIVPGEVDELAKRFEEMKKAHGFQRPPKVAAPAPETVTG